MKTVKGISSVRIRQLILEMAKRANVGHIGSALSIADIIAALYANVLRVVNPDASNRDDWCFPRGTRRWRSMPRFI